jgi:outer membrane receptor protein involved in Fe transport
LEQEIEFTGPEDRDDNLGEIGTPELKFTSTLSLIRGDWEVLMQNRFIGDGQQDDSDPFAPNDAIVGSPVIRDVDFVDSVWYTDLSLTYFRDAWSVSVGINNLLDEPPPLIHNFEGPNRNNAVTSSGYDFFGRSIFMTARVSF